MIYKDFYFIFIKSMKDLIINSKYSLRINMVSMQTQ